MDILIDIAPLSSCVKKIQVFTELLVSILNTSARVLCSKILSLWLIKATILFGPSFCGAWLFLFSPLSQIEMRCFPLHFLQIYFAEHVLRALSWFQAQKASIRFVQNINSWLSISHLFALGRSMIFWTIDAFMTFWFITFTM